MGINKREEKSANSEASKKPPPPKTGHKKPKSFIDKLGDLYNRWFPDGK